MSKIGEDGEPIYDDRLDPISPNFQPKLLGKLSWPGPCPCVCNSGGFCGGCGHAGCGGRRR